MKAFLIFLVLLVPTICIAEPFVIIKTDMGNIEVELNQQQAPISTANFLHYVDTGFYSNTVFHRVIPNFMVQGGGFTRSLSEKITGDEIKNEAANGLKNERGTIAMARTGVVDSATSQFFINHANNRFLNHRSKTTQGYGYAVFGRVTSGMDIVDAIATVATGRKKGMSDVPLKPVMIQAIERLEKK
ncbi:MAG: peptidylprolyl isomerase [Desulfuromonadales bacterium C00003068]|jgi:cyclophilin family peptidyl-prolyl cis-trans isomerase|nr:MAG: peptidylprolyl isomerase [Desulfuromonadales bacterium C00003068]